jgi:cobalt-zinc-cadmium efflux system membrane fusion protein
MNTKQTLSNTNGDHSSTNGGQAIGADHHPEVAGRISQTFSSANNDMPEPTVAPMWAISMAVGALAVGFIVGVFLTMPAAATAGKPAEAPSDPNIVKLDAAQMGSIKVEAASVQSFRGEKATTGRIAFNDDTSTLVFFPFTGRITKLFTEPGKAVKKGDPMIEFDSSDVVQPQADLVTAISSLKSAQTALRLAQKNEGIGKRELESAKRNLELCRINEQRQKDLFDDKAASKLSWETAEQATKAAEQTLETANKDFEQSQNDIDQAKANIDSADTVLNAARDRLHGVYGRTDAEIAQLEKTHSIDRTMRVVAPIDGTITQRKCYVGEFISPSITDPLFTIANLSTVWMLADVYETDDSAIKLGLPVEVCAMAYPDEIFKAKVCYISPSVDPNTHRMAVRCVVDNPGQRLKDAMFANFRIVTEDGIKGTSVPEKAVFRDGDKRIVWVKHGETEFQKREVTTGIEQDGRVQILKGLEAGETCVCQGGILLSGKGDSD